ncbi:MULTISPECIES: cellulase family glycosylhydrolase [unclassified Crossiella]|uniref:glycoside hydrolase 5 family protein n=1 Tax=unclassified Crossiella TaxID=2620835 RepID=UPI00200057B0|nr:MULTISPECIES: cellulase family glycosylhydrolase [unclassified Crossiella]
MVPAELPRRSFLRTAAAAPLAGAAVAAGAPAATASPDTTGSPASHRRRIRFGVNYVPSKNWWFSWADWDRASIARDLDRIAALGMDHIRIMCVWPELQPNPHYVRAEQLDRIADLLDLADRYRLDVEVTVFNGAVSGLLFIPPWLIDNGTGKVRDFFTDPPALAAQHRLLEALAARIGKHRRFLGFDLSNEVHWAGIPLGLKPTPAQGDAWHNTLFATCERLAPGKLHVSGIDHYPWLNDAYFSRDGLATSGTASAVHTWAGWTRVIQDFGPLSTPSVHYSEYFIEVIKAFHQDPHRQVWVEETGVSTKWMAAELIPEWTERSIRAMAASGDLFGITWWCSHDLNPALSGFNPLEYDLGLLTNTGARKPIAATMTRLIREYDHQPPTPLPRPVALVLPEGHIPGLDFLKAFARLIDRGIRPAVVKQSRSTDPAYLAGRRIERLVRPEEA